MKTYYITLTYKGEGRYQEKVRAKNPINAMRQAEKNFRKDNIIRNFSELLNAHYDDANPWEVEISQQDKYNMV